MAMNNLTLILLRWRRCNGNMVLNRPVVESMKAVNLTLRMGNCNVALSLLWRMCNMVLNRQVFKSMKAVNMTLRMCNCNVALSLI